MVTASVWERNANIEESGFIFSLSFFFFFLVFLWLYPFHIEVPRLEVEWKLQRLSYTTAIAKPDA